MYHWISFLNLSDKSVKYQCNRPCNCRYLWKEKIYCIFDILTVFRCKLHVFLKDVHLIRLKPSPLLKELVDGTISFMKAPEEVKWLKNIVLFTIWRIHWHNIFICKTCYTYTLWSSNSSYEPASNAMIKLTILLQKS